MEKTVTPSHHYVERYPSVGLADFVSLYFQSKNPTDQPKKITICPDGYFKLIIQLREGKIISYFLTGLWVNEVEIVLPPMVTTYGIKFKIIAAEYLLKKEIGPILNSVEQLNTNFWNIKDIDFSTFEGTIAQLEAILYSQLPPKGEILGNRLRISQFLYSTFEDVQAREVAKQIYWSHRQINRYLNKYIGVSLKKYLNIQKCYRAYLHIREGEFYPEKGFFDQAHFIREVKKHTGQTPTKLYQKQNDQFIQLRNIQKL